jgi:hypothetical protein
MTSATRSVAVVATRLPLIDRRALSQAWFSALHVAAGAPSTRPKPRSVAPPTRASAAGPARAAHAPRPAHAPPSSSGPHAARSLPVAFAGSDRRRPVDPAAHKIGRALARHAVPTPTPTTLAIDLGGGRVQLLVRTVGGTTRIVALCAPQVRERVDRALAAARFMLAAHGTRVEDVG